MPFYSIFLLYIKNYHRDIIFDKYSSQVPPLFLDLEKVLLLSLAMEEIL